MIFARRAAGGRLAAYLTTLIDPFGRPEGAGRNRRWPPVHPDTVVLVHLLSPGDAERRAVVADLSAEPLALAA